MFQTYGNKFSITYMYIRDKDASVYKGHWVISTFIGNQAIT